MAKYSLKVVRIHTHIGSGSDPAVWQKVSGMSIDLCRAFPTVTTLNLGGGYKVGRMAYEKSTDLAVVGVPVCAPAHPPYASLTCVSECEWSCLETAGGAPRHGRVVSQSTHS